MAIKHVCDRCGNDYDTVSYRLELMKRKALDPIMNAAFVVKVDDREMDLCSYCAGRIREELDKRPS